MCYIIKEMSNNGDGSAMAKYGERALSTAKVVLFLAVLALLLYQPWHVGDKELYWQEGQFAAEAVELRGFFSGVTAHGELIGTGFPLFPLLAGWLNEAGMPMESALRLLSLLPVLGVAVWVFALGRSVGGSGCGGAAAAVWLTSNIVMEKCLDGYPEMAMIFFVCGGQFIWFTLGQGYNHWNWAWAAAGAFAALAFLSGGFPALGYFAFPFIFMRRPLSVKSKLNRPGAAVGAALIFLTVACWLHPYLAAGEDGRTGFFDFSTLSRYYSHLLTFPVDAVWRLLPWSLLAWPVFCAAYRPLDPAPIFSRFLRTLVIAGFFMLWFSPFSDVRDIALLAPALSILIAVNYSLLMRRHGHVYRKLFRPVPYLAMLCGMLTVGFFLMDETMFSGVSEYVTVPWGKLDFRLEREAMVYGIASGTLMFLIGFYLLCRRNSVPMWVAGALMMLTPMLFYWSVARPFSAQKSFRRDFAAELRRDLGSRNPALIYKLNIAGLYGECFYLGIPVKSIGDLSEIPAGEDEVYLLATGFPQLPERGWVKISDKKLMDASDDEKPLQLYCGKLVAPREKTDEQ